MNRPITMSTLIRMLLVSNGLTLLAVVAIVLSTPTFARTLAQITTAATPPATVPYQGTLTDASGTPINDSVAMTFKFYAAPTGGTALWTEQRTGSNAVPVTNGLFSVALGQVTPIPANVLAQALWLGISVNGDAEMTPREAIQSSLSSHTASEARSLAANAPIKGNNIWFNDTSDGGNVVLRHDGGRFLHLVPWGGPEYRWDGVCLGCGSGPVDLLVRGKLQATNSVTSESGNVEMRFGSHVGTPDANCVMPISFNPAFPEKLNTVVTTNGDFNAVGFTTEVTTDNREGFRVRIIFTNGACRGPVRVNYIAVGQ